MRFFAFLFHSSVPKSLSSSPVESGDIQGDWGASQTGGKRLYIYPDTARHSLYSTVYPTSGLIMNFLISSRIVRKASCCSLYERD